MSLEASSDSDSTRAATFAGCAVLSALLIYLLPLLFFPRIPTQDGPLHVDTAAAMLESLGPDAASIERFLEIRFALETNTLGHDLLILCLWVTESPRAAERLFQLLYLTLFAGGAAFFLSSVRRDGWRFLPLLLPLAYSYIFHMGFYNNCLSICGFLFCWGALFRYDSSPSVRRLLALCACLFFTWAAHPVGTVAFATGALFWVAIELFVVRRGRFRLRLIRLLPSSLTVLLGLLASVFFFHGGNRAAGWSYESVSELTARLVHLSMMDSFGLPRFSDAMIFIASGLGGLFLLCAINAFRAYRRQGARDLATMPLLTLFYLAVFYLAPWDAAGSGYINERLMPCVLFFIVASLAATSTLPRLSLACGVIAMSGLHATHWHVYRQEERVERDYLFAAGTLERGAIVYPMHLASHGWDGSSYVSYRADFTNHLAGFYTAGNAGIYLNNTIARWREGRQVSFLPDVARGLDGLPPAFPGDDRVALDFAGFAKAAGRPVDYVLLYGNFSDEGSSARYYETVLQKTFDCSLVSPLGLVKLCKQQ